MRKYTYLLSLALLFSVSLQLSAKRKITFISEDGVTITADLYYKSKELPYVLLFHQDGYSRGEYNEIAEKIMNLNYNCLAVDLRSGDRVNYVENETARFAKSHGFASDYADAEKDMKAAIAYAYKKSEQKVILFGSSYSATLCLKQSINNGRISAIIAFDPGEYLKPEYALKDNMKELDKPVFIATNKASYPFVKEIFKETDPGQLTYFTPSNGKGEHGAKALWEESENNKEYWLALLMFFSKL